VVARKPQPDATAFVADPTDSRGRTAAQALALVGVAPVGLSPARTEGQLARSGPGAGRAFPGSPFSGRGQRAPDPPPRGSRRRGRPSHPHLLGREPHRRRVPGGRGERRGGGTACDRGAPAGLGCARPRPGGRERARPVGPRAHCRCWGCRSGAQLRARRRRSCDKADVSFSAAWVRFGLRAGKSRHPTKKG